MAPKLLRMAGNTGMIALGTGAGQGLILAVTPYLTRRYAPAQFGQLALLLTLSNIFLAVGCLRYDLALPGCRDHEKLPLAAVCAILGTALGAAAFLAARLPWGLWFHHPITRLVASPWLMLLLLLGVASYQAAGALLVREGRFSALALLRVSQGALFSAFSVLAVVGLVWAHILSYLGGGLLMGALIGWRARGKLARMDGRSVWAAVRRYRKFPVYSLPGALLDVLGYSACVWIIAAAYGLADAGQYSQIQRLIGAPMMLGSLSLSQVMLKQVGDDRRDGAALWPLVRQVGILMGLAAVILLAVLYGAGPWALRWILGARWRVDRYFVCLVASAVFIRSCVSPLSTVLISTQRFRPAFLWQSGYFLSTLTVLRWCSRRLSFDGFILGYALHELFHYSIYFLIIRKVAKG